MVSRTQRCSRRGRRTGIAAAGSYATALARAVILIDVLVATVLLGVALAVLIGIAGQAMRAQDGGRRLETAANLLDEQLQLVLARGADSYGSRFPVEGACDEPFQDYRFKLAFDGGDGGEPYRVTATVSWVRAGRTESESVQTLIAPRRGTDPDPERRPGEAVERK